ncbi:(Fe-S)-binding protein [Desulfomonile tiedjei]|uniref:Fe-S oxidoreductase n=1 Tax=Desulfomonile tiedjei (strain ATCC 49306 / DSM 6799 / DCB-1) TaxID=706587 RepID=I4C7Y7_DESTA|nr:(Fe-S)-binding protein [Desulfomonile tiedjei]AFM25678.1 Fe-S oxidoreductase [Desulfomonile tiedjei DSM 6799]
MDENLKKRLLEMFSEKLTRAARLYLDNCTRCGVCIEACHVYASMPETRYTAVARAQNVRRVYEKYFKASGKFASWWNEAVELDDAWMEKIYETAFTCTGCRRCMTYCPFGIDTQLIQGIAKLLLIGADMEPKVLTMLANVSISKGKNIEATKANFAEAVRGLESEVIQQWQTEAGEGVIPLEVKGARVLYVALAGKHSIIPAAAIMNAAKEHWSLSYFEAVNFGAFVGNPESTKQIARRIIDEAERLNVEQVVICECGTAYRVMRHMTGSHPFKVITFMELIAEYLREGRIKLDKSRIKGRITYHDPCQIARQGGIYEEPRYILNALTDDFVDLQPNRRASWCCGGGGGLVIMGDKDFRMKSAKVKADQVKVSGADILATACENCHTQLTDLMDHYKLDTKVQFVSGLVADALVQKKIISGRDEQSEMQESLGAESGLANMRRVG